MRPYRGENDPMRTRLGALAIGVVMAAGSVEAQQPPAVHLPMSPIAPKDRSECDALRQQWDLLSRQFSERHSQCLDAHSDSRIKGAGACSKAPCLPFHAWPPPDVASQRDAQIKACRDEVEAYQRQLQEEKARREEAARKAAEEQRRSESDARRERDRKDARDTASKRREEERRGAETSREREKREAEDRRRERGSEEDRAARRERERQERVAAEDARQRAGLERLLTANREAAERSRDRAAALGGRLDQHAAAVERDNQGLFDRLLAVPEAVKKVGDLLSDAPSGVGFDLGGGAAGSLGETDVTRTLDRAETALAALSPFSSIPFAMVRNVVEAHLDLQRSVFDSLENFERLDARFSQRDFVTEFGERAFSPREFLTTIVVDHALMGWVSETVISPAVQSASSAVRSRVGQALEAGSFRPLYRPVDPPEPRPVVDHFWSFRSGGATRVVTDDAGTTLLFDRSGQPVGFDAATNRVRYSPREIERLVATTDARPRRHDPGRWEENGLIWTPSTDDADPWWLDTPVDPGWWVTRSLEEQLTGLAHRLIDERRPGGGRR